MNYQGRVAVDGQNFTGTGYFKFALIDGGSNVNRTATATATVNMDTRVSAITVVDGGSGYRDQSPPAVTISGTGFTGATSLTIGGNDATGLTFNGVIQNTTGSLALSKTGSGMQTLSGANTYTGPTLIDAGKIAITAPYSSLTDTTINSGGRLLVNTAATASTMAPEPSMPIFTASTRISSKMASICLATKAASGRCTPVTPRVFWAVSAVIAAMP